MIHSIQKWRIRVPSVLMYLRENLRLRTSQYTTIRTGMNIDVEYSPFVAGDDSVQDPPTRPRILVGRLDNGKCVCCHAAVPRDVVAGASEHR